MMDGVRAPPEVVWREGQDADDAPDPIVGAPVREKRAMPAVMLNHEEPNQKPRRRDGDEQRRPPVAKREGEPRDDPERDQRQKRHDQFGDATCIARLAVTAEDLPQLPRVGWRKAGIVPDARAGISSACGGGRASTRRTDSSAPRVQPPRASRPLPFPAEERAAGPYSRQLAPFRPRNRARRAMHRCRGSPSWRLRPFVARRSWWTSSVGDPSTNRLCNCP